MLKKKWRRITAAVVLVPLLAVAGCSSSGGRAAAEAPSADGGQVANTPEITVALITHAGPGDTFWDIVRKGAEEAAAKDNVDLLYTADPDGGRQAQLVEQAIDQKVDGIVVTLAKPEAVSGAVQKAVDAGIPVVSINAGEDVSAAMGAFTHFGANDRLAGAAVGEKLKELGLTKPVCVIHEQGNVGHEARCEGVKGVIPATENLYVQGTDMTQVSSTVTAKLQAGADIDAVIGLGAPFTLTIASAVQETGHPAKVASFDLNPDLARSIADGSVLFTVDQQPWLQGYGAVEAIWQHTRGGFEVGGGQPVLTGPAIIDGSNAGNVLDYARDGIR